MKPRDEPTHTHTPLGLLILALCVILTATLGWVDAADAARYPTLERCALIHDTLPRRACIIRSVFRADGRAAVRVAWCESRLDPRARNGAYRGVFQMGASERARFGHGRTVLAQSRAAKRYFDLSGWSPWECRP